MQVKMEYPTPANVGLPAGTKARSPIIRIGRVALAVLCLSPLLVAIYSRIVPYAPMKGLDGTWTTDAWQHDLPSGFRTMSRGGELLFYASDAGNGACGPKIGSAPALGDDPSARVDGVVDGRMVTLSRDRGLLALSYDQYDPWVFFSRGPTPRRKVTVRFHQTGTATCAG